jgi:hypothetical protein
LETKWNVEMGQELSYYSITEGQPASKYTHPNKKNWIKTTMTGICAEKQYKNEKRDQVNTFNGGRVID